jgi:hypothetical protein
MPIRINLLAEAQAAEELRRRDPVKRSVYIGAFLIAAVLSWASVLQARIALQKNQLASLEQTIEDLSADYGNVVTNQNSLASTRRKLEAVECLRTNRYLTGNLLNALQQVFVDDVRIVKIKTDFSYKLMAAIPPKTNSFNVVAGKPATSTEQIKVQIEALDASSNPGDRVNNYKEAISSLAHVARRFNGQEREVRLTGLNPPQLDSNGKQYVLFTLECPYPEIVR